MVKRLEVVIAGSELFCTDGCCAVMVLGSATHAVGDVLYAVLTQEGWLEVQTVVSGGLGPDWVR
jgi:hypothetical protein